MKILYAKEAISFQNRAWAFIPKEQPDDIDLAMLGYLIVKGDDLLTTYEDLLIEADSKGLVTKEKTLRANKGRIKGNRIAIKSGMTETEKKCIMAEELGHYYTGTGDILDQTSVSNRKQELHGRIYAYNKLIGLTGIIDAYKHHCQNLTESAKHLDVTEEFLADALNYYKAKYGKTVSMDNYVIYFEPCLGVLELA